MHQVRSELNLRGVTGMTSLCRRLREAMTIVAFSGRFAKVVKEVDFLRALRETISPLTESDIRRIFSYFEVCNAFDSVSKSMPKVAILRSSTKGR